MKAKVLSFVREHKMILENDRVLCALSSGADSVAMTLMLFELKDILKIDLGAAHFSHGFRENKSAEEMLIANEPCKELDIPFYHGKGDINKYCS